MGNKAIGQPPRRMNRRDLPMGSLVIHNQGDDAYVQSGRVLVDLITGHEECPNDAISLRVHLVLLSPFSW